MNTVISSKCCKCSILSCNLNLSKVIEVNWGIANMKHPSSFLTKQINWCCFAFKQALIFFTKRDRFGKYSRRRGLNYPQLDYGLVTRVNSYKLINNNTFTTSGMNLIPPDILYANKCHILRLMYKFSHRVEDKLQIKMIFICLKVGNIMNDFFLIFKIKAAQV